MLSSDLNVLLDYFLKLPGVGHKTAQRLVFFLIKQPKEIIQGFSEALLNISNIKQCKKCLTYCEDDICDICKHPKRQSNLLCVVSDVKDMAAIEQTNTYQGVYFITHGLISPMEGVGPSDIHLVELFKLISDTDIDEVILAFPDTVEASATSLYISKTLKSAGVKVSRIAYGISAGVYLDQADPVSLAQSLKGRTLL